MNQSVNYNNHYYLSGKDAGFSKRLVGKVLFVSIMIDFCDKKWNEYDYRDVINTISESQKYMISEANKSYVHLSFDNIKYKVELKDFLPDSRGNISDYAYKAAGELGYKNEYDLLKSLKFKHGSNEVILLFFVNTDMRSYAHKSESRSSMQEEYAVIFGNEGLGFRTIVHEIMHIFGAMDYYYPDYVDDISKSIFPGSIMNGGKDIDDLTRYVIGWTNTLSSAANLFLEKTKDITKDYIKNELKKINNQENEKLYGNHIRGKSDFKNINIFQSNIKSSKVYSNGLLQEYSKYDKLGNIIYVKKRLENNGKIRWSWCFADNTYDSNNNLKKTEIIYYSDGNKIESRQIISLFYNDQNDVIKQVVYSYGKDTTEEVFQYKYDYNNNTRITIRNGQEVDCIEFDEKRHKKKKWIIKNGKYTLVARYEYNDYYLVIEEEINGIVSKYKYTIESNKITKINQSKDRWKDKILYILDVYGNCVEVRKGFSLIREYEYY